MKRLILFVTLSLATYAAPAGTRVPADDSLTRSPLQVALMLAALTVLPAIFVSITPFLRLIVVFHFLRQAIGTQTAPSNQVLVGLSLFLTLAIIRPVANEVYEKAWVPLDRGELTSKQAFDAASVPVKKFLVRFAREKDLRLFVEMNGKERPKNVDDLDLTVIAPAYVLSELKTGFQIGAVLFLPFLIVDLVVASVTLSVGMVQLPPVMVAAPFKVILFVLMDGWNLIVGSLLRSFQ